VAGITPVSLPIHRYKCVHGTEISLSSPSLPLRTHKGHEAKGGGNFDVRREGVSGLAWWRSDELGVTGDNGSSRWGLGDTAFDQAEA